MFRRFNMNTANAWPDPFRWLGFDAIVYDAEIQRRKILFVLIPICFGRYDVLIFTTRSLSEMILG